MQEKIGDYLSSSRDHKAMGRRPFDKMATLLAYLGPPEHRAVDTQFLFSNFTRLDRGINLIGMIDLPDESKDLALVNKKNIFQLYQYLFDLRNNFMPILHL